MLQKCEVYHGDSGGRNWLKRPDSPGRFYSHCPYIKTHEPFFWEPSGKPKSYLLSVERAAIILRHPFDSALSEFKRYDFGRYKIEEVAHSSLDLSQAGVIGKDCKVLVF